MLSDEILGQVKASLFAGQYNLLLGSGISRDSSGRNGKPLLGAADLASTLCNLKGARPNTPLSRVSLLLDPAEVKLHLTDHYFGTRPGPTVKFLPDFLWKTAFTFNIDDAVENAYLEAAAPKQHLLPLNFDSNYQTAPSQHDLPLVHLHGTVNEPAKGYVFSVAEYGRVTRGMNPWMHVLSELLASEPFIISGTSLNESDLEFYLSGRTDNSPRKNRGPSLLIEPFPDAVTENDCQRHGLVLVKATLHDFLAWLRSNLGSPPSLEAIKIPPLDEIFGLSPPKLDLISFFSSFELIRPIVDPEATEFSPFFYGRPPTWTDLALGFDVPTDDELALSARARVFLDEVSSGRALISLLDEAGTGKTTCIRRVGYELSKEGRIVFSLIARAAIDVDTAKKCLSLVKRPFVLLIDGTADHAASIRTLLDSNEISSPFLVLGADREYREDHIDRLLGDMAIEYFPVGKWKERTLVQLVEKYRKNGLLGAPGAITSPDRFASNLRHDVVAIATCRILNDFRPLEGIVKSLWNDATAAARRTYLVAALSYHCQAVGLYYPVLVASQDNELLADQLELSHPLPLTYSHDDDAYVVPLNPIVADRALILMSRDKPEILLEVFVKLAGALAPHVNRRAIMNQAPEARIAGRLFGAEKVVRPLLGDLAGEFFRRTKPSWEWNSRYWEQRALLTQTSDLDTAIQYARHAVAIEAHPYPWTTLASLLFRKMVADSGRRTALFSEAYELLFSALREEAGRGRPSPHPFQSLFHGTIKFLEGGGVLAPAKKDAIKVYISKAEILFSRDTKIQEACKELSDLVAKA